MAVIFEGRNELKEKMNREMFLLKQERIVQEKRKKTAAIIFGIFIFPLICGFCFLRFFPNDELFSYVIFFALVVISIFFIYSVVGYRPVRTPSISDAEIYGYNGEQLALELISTTLNDSFAVFHSLDVEYDGNSSQIDNIIVGPTGVFVCEVKHHNGYIKGNSNEKSWTQYKHGTYNSYSDEFYNPVKQVKTHIYRVANYLRDNGIFTFINGAVLFTNKKVRIDIESEKIPVFDINHSDDFINYILSGKERLNKNQRNEICKVLMKLI